MWHHLQLPAFGYTIPTLAHSLSFSLSLSLLFCLPTYLAIGHEQRIDWSQFYGARLLPVAIGGLRIEQLALHGETDLIVIPLEYVDGHFAQLDVYHINFARGASIRTGGADASPELGGHILCLLVDVIQMQFNFLLRLFEQLTSIEVCRRHLVQSRQQQWILGHTLYGHLQEEKEE